MTLVETLAVVALLGLVATLAVGAMGPMATAQKRLAAIGAAHEAVARARVLAPSPGEGAAAVQLVGGESFRIERAGAEAQVASLADIRLPGGWSAVVAAEPSNETTGRSTPGIAFDGRGGSQNGRIELRGPAALGGAPAPAPEVVRLTLLGISGELRRMGEDEP